jgi:Ankyrin repeat
VFQWDSQAGAFARDRRTKGETPLCRAAAFSDVETIQRLLHAGAKLDSKDMNGDTPLDGRAGTRALMPCSGRSATMGLTFAKGGSAWKRTFLEILSALDSEPSLCD